MQLLNDLGLTTVVLEMLSLAQCSQSSLSSIYLKGCVVWGEEGKKMRSLSKTSWEEQGLNTSLLLPPPPLLLPFENGEGEFPINIWDLFSERTRLLHLYFLEVFSVLEFFLLTPRGKQEPRFAEINLVPRILPLPAEG